jgi:uncharacterized membrane protein/thiol-disulfide isomerase/thioredoxin
LGFGHSLKGSANSRTMQRLIIFITLLFSFYPVSSKYTAQEQSRPVVNAVLFYSPTCGHCHYVITEVLPPLLKQYGDQLNIVGIDVTQAGGQVLFQSALKYFNLESGGVPMLVVGDYYLVGDIDIPEQFPGLIEQYLALGGVDWPAIPGLADVLVTPQPTEAPSATAATIQTITPMVAVISTVSPTSIVSTPTPKIGLLLSGSQTSHLGGNFANDPLGNSLAVVVLVMMILSLVGAIIIFQRKHGTTLTHPLAWVIPILCVIGLAVAGYLAYVESTQVEAICGPVGDCNTVQQSEYARLFGIIPILILGMAGYVSILLAWVIGRFANQRKSAYASLTILVMTTFGVLFSIYLTFLEPFVIGATCAWCLTSAIIMTALLWISIFPGKQAFTSLFPGEKHAFKRRSSRCPF